MFKNLKPLKNIFLEELYLERYKEKIKNNGYSEEQIHNAFSYTYFLPKIKNIFLKNIIFLINVKILNNLRILKYKINCLIDRDSKNNINVDDINFSSRDLKPYSEFYKKNGYCFIENFLDKDSYTSLLNNWPSENLFPPILTPTRYYSFSFGFENQIAKNLVNLTTREKIQNVKNINKSKILEKLYKFILSDKNQKNFSDLYGTDENWKCYLIFATIAKEDAYLIPHRDKVNFNEDIDGSFNASFFVDGENEFPEYSGALGLYEDNHFGKSIFIPSNLKNTLFIYDTKKNFYHGFPRVRKGGYRKTINMAFLKTNL